MSLYTQKTQEDLYSHCAELPFLVNFAHTNLESKTAGDMPFR